MVVVAYVDLSIGCWNGMLATTDSPRQPHTDPENPRQAQAGPDKPRQAQTGPDRPRQAQTDPDRNRQAQPGPERHPGQNTKKPVSGRRPKAIVKAYLKAMFRGGLGPRWPGGHKWSVWANRPRQAQTSPDMPRQAQTSPDRPRQSQTGPKRTRKCREVDGVTSRKCENTKCF